MANNVVIDIDARTKNFESALDELTAKVRSTAAQMDKAFSTSGSAEKSIKATSNAVGELHSGLKEISLIAAGNVLAEGFEKALGKIRDVGKEIYNTTSRMQSLEMGMKSLVTSDLLKTGQVKDYTEATAKAEVKTKELMDWFKDLSLKSPYELMEVMTAFKDNANMGQSVEIAKKTTEAILALGAGLGMGQAEMKRFSAALAQTGATGRITAMDLRQFANNGFGMDKMNQIFDILSQKYNILIKDNNDFNKAVAEGKVTTDDFFIALNTFALDNYGNAVDAMASTIEGLKSSLGDIKVSAINDLFLETSKTVSKTLAPYVEYLMKMITGGDFTKWGEGINKWAQGILEPFQKIGTTLENGSMSRAIKMLKDFFSGKSLNLGAVKTMLADIGGVDFADKWLDRIKKLKEHIDKLFEHKDEIISAIKGIGAALLTAFAINKISAFIGILGKLNNPVTKLTLLGAAFGLAWNKNLFDIQGKTQGVIQYIQDLISTFQSDGIKGVLEKIKTDVSSTFDNIKNSVSEKFTEIQNAFQTNGLKGVFDLLVADIKPTLQKIWDGLPEGLKEKIETVVTDVTNFIEPIKNAIKNAFSYIGDLKELFDAEGIGAVVQKVFSDAVNKVKDILKDILPESVIETLEKVWGWIDKIAGALGGIALGVGLISLVDDLLTVAAVIWDLIDLIGLLASAIDWPIVALVALATIGFSIIGQFINFGELIKNIFNTVKDSVTNVVNGIITNVAPKFQQLLETLQPFITTFEVLIGTVGTVLAGILLSAGVLIVGALNGIIRGLDDLIAAVIDAVDFVFSMVRLPFDLIAALFGILIGIVTGDNEKIKSSVEGLVERLKHIWNSFKAVWVDIWGFIKDFFLGIWHVIESTINSIDISAGLEKLFGAEVAQKFEEIRDKVLGFIEEIKNAWQHMLGLLNGDIVVMGNGQEVSKKTYKAFEEKHGVDYLDNLHAAKNMTEWDYLDKFKDAEGIYTRPINELKEEYKAFQELSEETLFEDFIGEIFSDIRNQNAMNIENFGGKISDKQLRGKLDDYVAKKYDFISEDPYMQSRLDELYQQLGLNTEAVKDNTSSTDTNTKVEEKTAQSKEGKSESTAASNKAYNDVRTELTKQQMELVKTATDSLSKDVENAINTNKIYNKDAIESLHKLVSTSEGRSLETINNTAKAWVEAIGLDSGTQEAMIKALDSAESNDQLVSMIGTLCEVLETGYTGVISEIESTGAEYDSAKIAAEIAGNYKNQEKVSDSIERPKFGLIGDLFGDLFNGDEYKNLQAETEKQTETIKKQNDSLTEAIEKLGMLEVIKDIESDDTTDKEIKEAKETFLSGVEELGATKKQLEDIKSLLDNASTADEIAAIMRSFTNALTGGMPTWHYDQTDTYYLMETNLRKFINDELPKSLNNLSQELNGQPMAHMDKWVETMKKFTDLSKGSAANMTEEQYAKFVESAINHSHLPENIKDAYLTAIQTEGVDKTFIADYISSTLIPAIEQAGLIAAGGKEDQSTATPSFKDAWDKPFQDAFTAMYQEELSGHAYQIYMEQRDNADKYAGMSEEAALTAALKNLKLDEKSYYDSLGEYHNLMETLSPALQSTLDKVGINSDTFSHVTVDNWSEAKDYITAFDDFDSLYQQVMEGTAGDNELIANRLEMIMGDLADDESAKLLSGMLAELKDPEWSKAFMSLMKGEMDDFKKKIDDNLNKTKAGVASGGGANGQTTGGQVKAQSNAIMKQWEDNWKIINDMTKSDYERAKATYQNQAILNATYRDFKDQDFYNWNMSNGDTRKWNILDPRFQNQEYADEVTRQLYEATNRGLWSENIYKQDYRGRMRDYLTQKNFNEQELAMFSETELELLKSLKESDLTDEEKINELDELFNFGDEGDNGLLGMLFGKGFKPEDLTQLFASGLEGLGEFLNEDTIASIQSLFDVEIDEEKAGAWRKMSTALSLFGTAMTTLQTAMGTGESSTLQTLTDDVKSLMEIPITEESVDKWKNLAKGLSEVAKAMTELGRTIGDSSSQMASDDTTALRAIENLKEIANIPVSDDLGEKWRKLGSGLSVFGFAMKTVSDVFTNGTSFIDELNNLLTLVIPENAAQNWNDFASALQSMGTSMKSVVDAFGTSEGGASKAIVSDLTELTKIEIDSTKIDAWSSFAKTISRLGAGISIISASVGDNTSIETIFNSLKQASDYELDSTKIDAWNDFSETLTNLGRAISTLVASFSSDTGIVKTLFDSLKQASDNELDNTKVDAWNNFADSLSKLGNSISNFKSGFGNDNTLIVTMFTAMKTASDVAISSESIEKWLDFAKMLMELSTALTAFISSFGDNAKTIQDNFKMLSNAVKLEIPRENLQNWIFLTDVLTLLGTSVTNFIAGFGDSPDAIIQMFNTLKQVSDIELDAAKLENWLKFSAVIDSLGVSIGNIKTSFGEDSGDSLNSVFTMLQNFASMELPENAVDGWINFATAMTTLGTAMTALQSVFGGGEEMEAGVTMEGEEGATGLLGALQALASMTFSEEMLTGWTTLAESISTIGTVMTAMEGFQDMLTFTDVDTSGMQAIADLWSSLAQSVVNFATAYGAMTGAFTIGEEGEVDTSGMEGSSDGMMSIFDMIFGDMDVESILAILQALTPETLGMLMMFMATSIDEQVTESWIAFGEALRTASISFMQMVAALTGGSIGEVDEEGNLAGAELGDEVVGESLADAFYSLADAAAETAPMIDATINSSLQMMVNYFSSIVQSNKELIQIWQNEWKSAVKKFVQEGEKAISTVSGLEGHAKGAEKAFLAWADAIWAVINALRVLNSMGGGIDGGNGSPNSGTGGGAQDVSGGAAGGTHNFRYGTAIVGEHGPELITNNTSQAWQVFSNNTLMDEIARTRHSLNLLSNSAEYVAYNRILGSSGGGTVNNDNSQNINTNFGTVIGDDAFRQMIEEELTDVVRRELWLGGGR